MTHPTEIKLHQQSGNLEIAFDDGARFTMPYEYLRVQTPSAEARGHGPGQETLQTGKKNVKLQNVEPVGTYALRLIFDDGHDSGLYTWEYLYELGQNQDVIWKKYLEKLEAAGESREFSKEKAASSCGHHSGGCGH